MNEEHIQNVLSHADKIYNEAKAQSQPALNPENYSKRTTWVGMNKFKPYAHLRELMVSELMARIVDPEHVEKPSTPPASKPILLGGKSLLLQWNLGFLFTRLHRR